MGSATNWDTATTNKVIFLVINYLITTKFSE